MCINPAVIERGYVATIDNEFHVHLITQNIDIHDAVSYELCTN